MRSSKVFNIVSARFISRCTIPSCPIHDDLLVVRRPRSLGEIPPAGAASLLLAPCEIARRTSISLADGRGLCGAPLAARLAMGRLPPPAHPPPRGITGHLQPLSLQQVRGRLVGQRCARRPLRAQRNPRHRRHRRSEHASLQRQCRIARAAAASPSAPVCLPARSVQYGASRALSHALADKGVGRFHTLLGTAALPMP